MAGTSLQVPQQLLGRQQSGWGARESHSAMLEHLHRPLEQTALFSESQGSNTSPLGAKRGLDWTCCPVNRWLQGAQCLPHWHRSIETAPSPAAWGNTPTLELPGNQPELKPPAPSRGRSQ